MTVYKSTIAGYGTTFSVYPSRYKEVHPGEYWGIDGLSAMLCEE